jgi:DNA modification methylase
MFRRTAYSMIKDLQHFSYEKCSTAVKEGDARHLPLQDESIDAVITSPPYLNNIDYQKVYEIENFILGGAAAPALRSFISDSEYFKDMELVLKELYRVCAHSAKLAIVVGNGFTKEIVESDMILSDMAEKIGFKINKIIVMNKRFALKDRTKKIGKIRESMILMEKD